MTAQREKSHCGARAVQELLRDPRPCCLMWIAAQSVPQMDGDRNNVTREQSKDASAQSQPRRQHLSAMAPMMEATRRSSAPGTPLLSTAVL